MSSISKSWKKQPTVKEFLKSIPEGLDKDKVTPVILSEQIAKNLRNILLKDYKINKRYHPAKIYTRSLAVEYNKNELLSIVSYYALEQDTKHLSKMFGNEVALIQAHACTEAYDMFINKLEFFHGPLLEYADEVNKIWDDTGMCWGYRIKG